MKILIVGFGTIGKPLVPLFLKTLEALTIEEIMFHKNTPELDFRGGIVDFCRGGAKLVVFKERWREFQEILKPFDVAPTYTFEEALERADVVIDCTKEGIGRALKEEFYTNYNNGKRVFVAQGSEKGFGKPYAFSINDSALHPEKDKFLQVVSCNTHQLLCILKTLVFDYEGGGNLIKARFALGRRAADISQRISTIGMEFKKPIHAIFGSHQAEDADRILQTMGMNKLDIHAQAIISPQPFMHFVSFRIEIRTPISHSEVERRFRENPLVAVTYWQTNNEVFSEGRDRGHFGRILNQTVVHLPTLEVISRGKEIAGICSTPQDGNALLSSMAATLWSRSPEKYQEEMRKHFFNPPFIFNEI